MSTNTRTNLPSGGLQRKFAGALIACIILLGAASLRAEKVDSLKAQGYVNDFAGVLSEQTNQQLTALCTEVDQKAHAQIAVVTIRTLDDLEAADFANRLFKRWGVGHQDDNRGVLILVAVDDHKYWIEVGYGLEPILPDGKVGGFGREMVPRLRAGDYNGGLLHLTSEIADVVARDRGITLSNGPPPGETSDQTQTRPGLNLSDSILWTVLILVFILLTFVTRGRILWWVLLIILQGSRGGGSRSSGGFGGGGGGFGGFGGGASGGGGAGGSW
jgi:uncharacterized protein